MSDQFPDMDGSVREVTAAELKARVDAHQHVVVLDTRRESDFETWHIDGPSITAVNVPFTAFLDGDDPADAVPAGFEAALPADYDPPIVTCCAEGISSLYVAEFLAREGYEIVALEAGMRGWAGLYEATVLASPDTETDAATSQSVDAEGATVVQFHRPSSGCLAYLVVSAGEAMIVDPLRAFANEYPAAADDRDATVVYAVDTHVHADHVSGVDAVAAATDATPVLPAGATDRGYTGDATFVADGDELAVGDVTVDVVAIPGHTSEMIGYRVGDVFLTGDTVFTDAVARPDLEAGAGGARDAARELYDTIQGLAALPDDTLVAPGHASDGATAREDGSHAATLAELRERVPAFEREREAFVDAVLEEMPPRPNNYEAIIDANLGRRELSDSDAFELELGPNNCAAGE